ncbi:hypothetical protein IJ541_05990 [bacterium]|nr:hypothetical protein [bacterium]
MKRLTLLILVLSIVSCCCAIASTYKVNTSGVVKTPTGKVISSPSNAVNQNYYNNFSAPNYISSNQVNSGNVDTIEIVMDYSGSMANWIGVAKRSMASIIAQIPNSTKLGFRVFGHDNYGNNPSNINTIQDIKQIVKKGNKISVITQKGPLGSTSGVCSATQQVAGVVSANEAALINGMNSVGIGGATPLVYALDRAVYQDFSVFDTTSPKKIVLITDGGENCGGDPCAFARKLMSKRSDIHIDVVLVSSNSRALSCLASTTGGHFYNIDNLTDFSGTLTRSIQAQPTIAPKQQTQQQYEFIKD